jgi:hypothetical protein
MLNEKYKFNKDNHELSIVWDNSSLCRQTCVTTADTSRWGKWKDRQYHGQKTKDKMPSQCYTETKYLYNENFRNIVEANKRFLMQIVWIPLELFLNYSDWLFIPETRRAH